MRKSEQDGTVHRGLIIGEPPPSAFIGAVVPSDLSAGANDGDLAREDRAVEGEVIDAL